MVAYLKMAGGHLKAFKRFKIEQVPRVENVKSDSLARLASRLEDRTLGQALIEILAKPNTKGSTDHIMTVDPSPSWIDLIFEFLMEGKTLEVKNEARRIKYQANKYMILNRKLYKRGYICPTSGAFDQMKLSTSCEKSTRGYAATVQGKEVWRKKHLDNGTIGQPYRNIHPNLFGSATNAKDSLMS